MPYWRLSNFYLFYFASLGALLPYWALYLKHLGFDARSIGELMAVLMATKILAPNLWGWIADRTGRRMGVVRFGSAVALIAFAGVFLAREFWPLAGAMFLFSFFWNAVLPQFEAVTLTHLGRDTHRYSIVRLWGSIGFIVAVTALGVLLQAYGPALLPWVLAVLFAGIWLASLAVPESHNTHEDGHDGPLRQILRRPPVLALIAVSFLLQASHGPYYTFYTIFMEEHGYSRTVVGQLWALGVVAEVGLFLVMHRLVLRFGLGRLMIASLLLTTVRWAATGAFPEYIAVVLAAQTLHAASFGLFHAVAVAFYFRYFAGRHHGQGQAFYSSLSFGAGGAMGAWYSGMVWDAVGPQWTYFGAAAASALGALIAWRWLRGEG